MKNSLKTAAFVLAMILGWSFEGMAQTTQYVTLTAAYAYGGLIGGLGALGTVASFVSHAGFVVTFGEPG